MNAAGSAAEAATGIERIAAAFAGHGRRAALMPYLMGGFPDTEGSLRIARACLENGADLVEFGLPFSDPLADGPVVHQAGSAALAAGAVTQELVERIAPVAAELPVMVMTYFNIIHRQGVERFLGRCAQAGVCGLIVPDIPLEESEQLVEPCRRHGIALVQLVAPTTPEERVAEICARAEGFVYTVAVTGTTGERSSGPSQLDELVARVRRHTELPVAVGFGISDPAQASAVAELADGAIVGSRFVRAASEAHGEGRDPAAAVGELVAEFAAALA